MTVPRASFVPTSVELNFATALSSSDLPQVRLKQLYCMFPTASVRGRVVLPAPFRSYPAIEGDTGDLEISEVFTLNFRPHGRFPRPAIFKLCRARFGP